MMLVTTAMAIQTPVVIELVMMMCSFWWRFEKLLLRVVPATYPPIGNDSNVGCRYVFGAAFSLAQLLYWLLVLPLSATRLAQAGNDWFAYASILASAALNRATEGPHLGIRCA